MQFGAGRILTKAEFERNTLGTEQDLSRVAYSVWVPAGEWDGEAPATYITPSSTEPGYWYLEGTTGLEPTKDSIVYYYMRRPMYWGSGHIEPRAHITTDNDKQNVGLKFGWKFVSNHGAFGSLTFSTATVYTGPVGKLQVAVPKDAFDTKYMTAPWATEVINPDPVGQYGMSATEPNVPPVYEGLYFGFGHNSNSDNVEINVKFYGMELIFYQHGGTLGGGFYGDFYLGDNRTASA